jgi:sucrose-6-phosphate hydrolase SacC (GH32 family)
LRFCGSNNNHLIGRFDGTTFTMETESIKGKVRLQVLVGRSSIEVFGPAGRFSRSSCFLPPSGHRKISLSPRGSTIQVKSLEVWERKSAWLKPGGG